ncbi:hypothetical protein [Streptomyces sp. ML-6]|uniref:hypothetical protein n=1 Tax=Streptomyces sp. ML-6 TaxID=2982693 RepID=UPI0024BFE5DB|nr:hypothetical protein [Streptomyces sp. ML-6]MDK0521821.1 hypothetical protein [Streptomyces sp. ML-6]
MSIRRSTRSRRAVAAVSLAAAMALAVTGCGTDDGGDKSNDAGSSPSSVPSKSSDGDKEDEKPEDTAAGENVDPNVKLAEIRGQRGITLVINQVKRDSGGFVTVQGEVKNGSDMNQPTSGWSGSEELLVEKNPNSVAGAALIDKAGKKRYYVLRDTDGRCLCTTGILPLQPNGSTPVFMQFPAPPSTTTEVDFMLPTFATTSLKISG